MDIVYEEIIKDKRAYDSKSSALLNSSIVSHNARLLSRTSTFTKRITEILDQYLGNFKKIKEAFESYKPNSIKKSKLKKRIHSEIETDMETYDDIATYSMETTNEYYANFLDTIIVKTATPDVKPKHIKFLFDLTIYNKFNELVLILNNNINILIRLTNTYKAGPPNANPAYTNLINQLKQTINSGLIYRVIIKYFNEMTEEVNVSPIFLFFIEKIIALNNKLDNYFTRAYENAFKAIREYDNDAIFTIEDYLQDFETLLIKETLSTLSFPIANNISVMITEENNQKVVRTTTKTNLTNTFTTFTNDPYFRELLHNYSIPQPVGLAGANITRFRNEFIEKGITAAIIAFKAGAIATIKAAVDAQVVLRVAANRASRYDDDYQVEMEKFNTFRTTYTGINVNTYEVKIYQAIILEYLTTEFELTTAAALASPAAQAVTRLIPPITTATTVVQVRAAYAAIEAANTAAAPGINHSTYIQNRLLPEQAMMSLCDLIYEILFLLHETINPITNAITRQITYPIKMSDAYTIINTIVDNESNTTTAATVVVAPPGRFYAQNTLWLAIPVYNGGAHPLTGAAATAMYPQFVAYARHVIKDQYSDMVIKIDDIEDNEDLIKTKMIKMKKDKENIDIVVDKFNIVGNLPNINETFSNIFFNIVTHFYLQWKGGEYYAPGRGAKKSTLGIRDLKNKLQGPFKVIFTIISKRKDSIYNSFTELNEWTNTNKESLTKNDTLDKYKDKLQKVYDLFIKIIEQQIEIDEDIDVDRIIKKQIKIFNGIIDGDEFNEDNYIYSSEDDEEDDEDDGDSSAKKKETTAKKDKSQPKDSKTAEAIETKFFKEIEKFIKQFKTLDEASIKQIMKHILSIDYPDEEFFKPIADKCFNLDGKECIELISACSRGDLSCIDKFQKLDFSKDIDIATIPIKLALDFAKTIGFYDKSVDDFYKAYKEKYTTSKSSGKSSGKSPDLHADVLKVFRAIKRKIDLFERKTTVCEIKLETKKRSPQMLLRHVASMTGGGNKNKNNYNDYIMNLNALKNNLSMSGGAGNTYSIFLDELELLKQLLKEQGKEIDHNSEVAIKDMIEKIHKYENRLKEMKKLTIGLIHILENTDYKISEDKGKTLTIDALKLIHKEQEKIKSKNSRKAFQLVGLLGSVPYPLFPAGYS
jgi:hypothetical protein